MSELVPARKTPRGRQDISTVTIDNETRVILKRFLLDHPLIPTMKSAVAVAIDQWIASETIKIKRGDYDQHFEEQFEGKGEPS